MGKHQVQDVRNVAFVGHGAVGKTTLIDLMLFKAGLATRAGSVDDGTSLLDIDDEEKERKSSVSSAVAHLEHDGKEFHILDTPGYPDFIGQAIGALAAVETALISISAGSGIEVNTRKVFEKAGNAGLARFIVLTKCDSENINFEELLSTIQESFGQACVPLNLPVGLGGDFNSVVSTLKIPDRVPAGVPLDPAEINQTLLDAVAEGDEALMERYLEGEELSPEEVAGGITSALKAGTLIPIFCVSGKADVGVTELLDGIAQFALAPGDLERTVTTPAGEEQTLSADPEGPLVAQVFKTRIDPFVAKLSYLRVFSGKLSKGDSVHASGLSKPIKISQLLLPQGGTQDDVDSASAGDIVAVVKMDDLKTNATLASEAGYVLPKIGFPTPMIGLAVEPKSRADQTKISGALSKVEEEDPTFLISRDAQTKEMVMHGMSELHLKLIEEKLLQRDKVEVLTHQPKIPYREAVTGSAEGSYRHKKQSGGSGQFAEVHFKISACPQGIDPEEHFVKANFENLREFHYDDELNSAFLDRISGGSIPNQFIPAVEKGVKERMTQGVLAGYQVQDTICELYFGKDHPVDSNETAFKSAASMCFREVFKQAKPVILEPIVNVEIIVPSDKLGDITSDLNGRRGRVEGMEGLPGGFQVIKAKAPLSEVMTYQRTLSSMTGGEGSYTLEFSHYEVVPPNEQSKIIAAAEKEKEEES